MDPEAAPSVMVLGPSEWLQSGVPSHLRLEGMTPLEARREVARVLEAYGARAVVMEDHARREGETHFDLFLRLVREARVRTFLILWPLGCRQHGVSVEIGYLLTSFAGGALGPDDAFILPEAGTIDLEEGAGGEVVLSVSEPGNRTRYYGDLIDAGCPMLAWETLGAMKLAALNVAMAHAARHAAPDRPRAARAGLAPPP